MEQLNTSTGKLTKSKSLLSQIIFGIITAIITAIVFVYILHVLLPATTALIIFFPIASAVTGILVIISSVFFIKAVLKKQIKNDVLVGIIIGILLAIALVHRDNVKTQQMMQNIPQIPG